MAKISVVMAVYNALPYLHEAVESVLAQTFRDFELLCVDDGSTDGSLAVLQSYAAKDARMRLLRKTEPSDGAAAARNLGLSVATGEYVIVLDADDRFYPDLLASAWERAEETKADIVLFDAWSLDVGTGRRLADTLGVFDAEHLPKGAFSPHQYPSTLLQMTNGAAWNKFLRRSFVEREQLRFQSFHQADDIGFTYPALMSAHIIAPLRKKLLDYRVRFPQSQTERIQEQPDSGLRADIALRRDVIRRGLYDTFRRTMIVHAMLHMLCYFLPRMRTFSAYCKLYGALRDGGMQALDFFDVTVDDVGSELILRRDAVMRLLPQEFLLRYFCATTEVEETVDDVLRHRMPQADHVILYGAGEHGREVFGKMIRARQHEIVAWVDRSYASMGYPIQAPAEIRKYPEAVVLVTVAQSEAHASIQGDLLAMGVDDSRIVWIGELERCIEQRRRERMLGETPESDEAGKDRSI